MNISLKKVPLPDFGLPEQMPEIPAEIYDDRCKRLYEKAGCDWVVVYADREHFANVQYLSNFDPRFEEALVILGPNGKKVLIVGNEGLIYTDVVRSKFEIILYQTFSLMGQDRSKSPRLDQILSDIGIKKGDKIGIVGWKYVEPEETASQKGLFVPQMIIDAFAEVAGDAEAIIDVTRAMMHPTDGVRAVTEAAQIAAYEWGAARASKAIARIVQATKPGLSEMEIVSHMQYSGEPMSVHLMYATASKNLVALRSPSGKKVAEGEGVFTALGYWGGLSARAGLVAKENDEFIQKWAIPYYKGIVAWYESASVGAVGGEVTQRVYDVMQEGGLRPMLNPGHLTGSDEWLHTMFRPGSEEKIASGMAIQCDIIPNTPLEQAITLNCEDSVAFADEVLRNELAEKYPDVWSRIQARQAFMRNELGINISDDLLPLSSTPGYFAPLFLASDYVLVKE